MKNAPDSDQSEQDQLGTPEGQIDNSWGCYVTAEALGHGDPVTEHIAIYLFFFIPGRCLVLMFFSMFVVNFH